MRRALPVLLVLAIAAVAWLAWRQGWLSSSTDTASTDGDADGPPGEIASGGLAGRGTKIDPNKDPASYEGDPVGKADAGLGKAGVHGLVTSDAGPIRFARVVAVLTPPASVAVRTTKSGEFTITGLQSGDVSLRASAEGFVSRTMRSPALADGVVAEMGEIRLKARPEAKDGIEAKVVDEDGRPIAGAKVMATTLDWSLAIVLGPRAGMPDTITKEATTDELGVARFPSLPAEKYDVIARSPEYTVGLADNVVVAEGRVEHVAITLHRGLSLSGVVLDADGAPVAKAHVSGLLLPHFRIAEMVESDTAGRFTLGGLSPGAYMVFAGRDDLGDGTAPNVKAGDRSVRIQLSGAGTLKGRVVAADGKPAPRFRVRPYIESFYRYTYSRQFAFEDADGRFSMTLSPGSYTLDVASDAGQFTKATATLSKDKTTEVEIRLPASAVVAGVVTDADGNHLAGAEVFVKRKGFPDEPAREQYVRTDADGHFVMRNLALEQIGLHVRCAGHASAEVMATPAPEGSGKELTVRLPSGATVVGTITSSDGKPVAGEQINLAQEMDFFGALATTSGPDGTFQFAHVSPGKWSASTKRLENASGGLRKEVTVPAEGTVSVDFHTEGDAEATGVITGVAKVGAAPVVKAEVYAEDGRGSSAAVTGLTDAEGKFTLRGLKPGRVTVNVSTASGLSDTKRVTIESADKPATVEFEFGSAGVKAMLVASDGKTPASGAWVMLEGLEKKEGAEVWEAIKAQVNSDERGAVIVTGVDPATYRLRINAAGYAARTSDPFTLGEGESKDLGVIRLQAGGSVRGRVTDDSGAPLEGVGVSVKNSRGEDVFLFNIGTTGSDGRYALSGIELGDYSVRFEGKGVAPQSRPVTVTAAGAVVDAVLHRGGSITVRVQDDRGQPVAGARVELFDASGKRVEKTLSIASLFEADVTRVNDLGTTTIPDLAPAGYRVGARKDGMALVGDPMSVTVEVGVTSTVTVVLKAGG